MELTSRIFTAFTAFAFLASSQVALAERVAKPGLSPEAIGVFTSVGEALGGGAMILTGVGAVPGAILIGKGVLDLAVNIRNIVRIQNGGDRGAASALGELIGYGGQALGLDPKASRKFGDAVDALATLAIPFGQARIATIAGIKALPIVVLATGKFAHDMAYASSGD